MAMILDALVKKGAILLADWVTEEAIVVLGVEDELPKLLRTMKCIQCLLKDAEKSNFNESIHNWLSELKDAMFDAEDIIDICRIKGNELLADENCKNKIFRVCCNFSSAFSSTFSSTFSSCITGVPLRREIGKSIKELNDKLQHIDENRIKYRLEHFEMLEKPQRVVNSRHTCSFDDPLVVGKELGLAANDLVDGLITENVKKKCRIFALAGMGGIGKTTLAKKIFNHPRMQNYFNFKIWVCVSQTSETELLKQIIKKANGNYGDANTTPALKGILRDSFASCKSLFLVLDDVWRADVWDKLLRVPLQNTNTSVRVLVTTRSEDVAKVMMAEHIHNVKTLSRERSWDMLHKLLFSDEEEQPSDDLKEVGFRMVEKCGGLPLAIKAIAGVLHTRERTKEAWQNILRSNAWSITGLHEDHIAALHLSFEDLPSHLKQCFLYFSLFGENEDLYRDKLARLWVAEGFITENQEGPLMEDVAEKYLNELLGRNLLLWRSTEICKMHVLVRSLVIFLSKKEASYGDENARIVILKPRRLSIQYKKAEDATKIFDTVARRGSLRTLLASNSDLLLDEERLKCLLHLHVLDISRTNIKELPDSIGDLVLLRYLDLSWTEITAIPESIGRLSYLQFLNISFCTGLTRLPDGITQLHNLRYLDMSGTSIMFMPKGLEKLKKFNDLRLSREGRQ